MLFRRRAIVGTLMWSLMDVDVEIGAQPGLQLTDHVLLVEIEVLTFDAVP